LNCVDDETEGNSNTGSSASSRLQVLLVEDDAGDAYLVQELLDEVQAGYEVTWVQSIADALTPNDVVYACVLLDLQLPDATELEGIHHILDRHPEAAVIVLTGLADSARGNAAVAAGAQDYLVKGEVEGSLLARSIRYAIERKRAEEDQRKLLASAVREEENSRLELGLLPVPILVDETLSALTRYRPGRHQALLGGDFYDALETEDGVLHVVIGDVCGHGPDQAALGVRLRIAWRTLVLAGQQPERVLPVLDRVLESERRDEEVFVTACMVVVDPDRRRATVYLAGHPAPILLAGTRAEEVDTTYRGHPLGLFDGTTWRPMPVELPESWALVLYTDGLIEGRVAGEVDRFGPERLVAKLGQLHAGLGDADPGKMIDTAIEDIELLNGGAFVDDLAVLLVARSPGRGDRAAT
jgi:serine phosphatase RsbU (regulator of sigma subunit)